jgi:cytochrome c peroxidase
MKGMTMRKAFWTALAVSMALAGAIGARESAPSEPRERWSAEEVRVLASLRLSELPPLPDDPSNAVANLPAAAALGKLFFNDTRFSSNGQVACASCHAEDKQFQDGLPLGRGVATGKRRTMPIAGGAYSPWLFWDGRKDSLWSQALGPLEDAAEHGSNRARYAHLVRTHYRQPYEAVFGPLPDLSSVPADASPLGTVTERAAWDRLDPELRSAVSRVFANIGKSIAAYERTLRLGESRFDRYAQGVIEGNVEEQKSLSPQEVRGLRVFIGSGQCATCHNGALFTDQHFHNTAVPARDRTAPDRGRAPAIAAVQRDEFNCMGPFSDARGQCDELRFIAANDPAMEGAFKTPSLRNVALRAPYMHAGQVATLEEVIAHYAKSPPAAIGHSELAHAGAGHAERKPIRLSAKESEDLAAFLRALSGPIVEVPPR